MLNNNIMNEDEQKMAISEAKILIVGQGSVGKTSIVKRLVSELFDAYENKTEGININQWIINKDNEQIRLNIWDFGGQEIMHATHQFFLTKGTLYLLVIDSRLDEFGNRLEYWLKIIQSYGENSPIIVVGNKIDQQRLDIDKRGLRNKYPSICSFVETSCLSNEGITVLKNTIFDEIKKLGYINKVLPLSWLKVKEQIENISSNYISYQEFVKICEKENITEPKKQKKLLDYLNNLGTIISFQGDPRLGITNILNPEWITTAVYKILNSNQLFVNKGVLDISTLESILNNAQYPIEKRFFLIDIMRKFELCFDFEGYRDKKFLIPDLLPKEEPYTGEWNDSLSFEYHYDVLPSSIISRFIVRMNLYIHQNTYWRNGVVLAYEGNKSLVRSDSEENIITIQIIGEKKKRRSFLAIIRSHFTIIHNTIPKISVKEIIPLSNHPEVKIAYSNLLKLEMKGINEYYLPECDTKINIKYILEGIEDDSKQNRGLIQHIEKEKNTKVRNGQANAEIQDSFDVFLCHNSADKAEVLSIANKLKENKISVWIDEWSLKPGEPWQNQIEKQLHNIKTVAVFVGQNNTAPWQNTEIREYLRKFAMNRTPIIPVILPSVAKIPRLPIFLEDISLIDYRKNNPDPFETLIWAITGKKNF